MPLLAQQLPSRALLSVLMDQKKLTILPLGDSITDGYGVQPNTNLRWTDGLIERLKGKNIAVLNLGIGGNRGGARPSRLGDAFAHETA